MAISVVLRQHSVRVVQLGDSLDLLLTDTSVAGGAGTGSHAIQMIITSQMKKLVDKLKGKGKGDKDKEK